MSTANLIKQHNYTAIQGGWLNLNRTRLRGDWEGFCKTFGVDPKAKCHRVLIAGIKEIKK